MFLSLASEPSAVNFSHKKNILTAENWLRDGFPLVNVHHRSDSSPFSLAAPWPHIFRELCQRAPSLHHPIPLQLLHNLFILIILLRLLQNYEAYLLLLTMASFLRVLLLLLQQRAPFSPCQQQTPRLLLISLQEISSSFSAHSPSPSPPNTPLCACVCVALLIHSY